MDIFLEVGNILFFFGGFPQLYKTIKMIKNREKMVGVSSLMFFAYALGCICFATVGYFWQSWFTFFANIFNIGFYSVVTWWARKK